MYFFYDISVENLPFMHINGAYGAHREVSGWNIKQFPSPPVTYLIPFQLHACPQNTLIISKKLSLPFACAKPCSVDTITL